MSIQAAPSLGALGPGRSALLWGCLSLTAVVLALAAFYGQSWYAPDEGVYAYVAQRILAGDVLNGNLQDLHGGYVSFLHAATLWLLGEDIRSLRYPLAVLTVLQAALVFHMLSRRHGPAYAALAAAAAGLLTYLMFLNPSANWYVLFIAFATIHVLAREGAGGRRREVAIGALLGAAFLFRQLSGVFLAIGVVTWLLIELDRQADRPDGARSYLARIILSGMGLAVVLYLWRRAGWDAAIMLGIWPIAIALIAAVRVRIANARVLRMILHLAIGSIAVALPLAIYHLLHGTMAGWVNDAFLAGLHLTQLDFIDKYRFWYMAYIAVANMGQGFAATVNGLFWLFLLAAPILLGASLARAAWKNRQAPFEHPLPTVAAGYALCSAHYEIPIYLTFTSGLTIVALLHMWGDSKRTRVFVATIVGAAILVGLAFQAGQPVVRGGLKSIVTGVSEELDAVEGLPGARLAMEREEQEVYLRLLDLIATHTQPGDAILALPVNPELYFLSHRKSMFRFNSSAIGILNQEDLESAVRQLREAPPPIVIYCRDDKYNNFASAGLMQEVMTRYVLAAQVGRFDVYLPRDGSS